MKKFLIGTWHVAPWVVQFILARLLIHATEEKSWEWSIELLCALLMAHLAVTIILHCRQLWRANDILSTQKAELDQAALHLGVPVTPLFFPAGKVVPVISQMPISANSTTKYWFYLIDDGIPGSPRVVVTDEVSEDDNLVTTHLKFVDDGPGGTRRVITMHLDGVVQQKMQTYPMN